MRTINGNITITKSGRCLVDWPGVERINRKRIAFEGREYLLLGDDLFPGMAKIIDEEYTARDGEVLILAADGPAIYIYSIYGTGTHFTTTNARTGKTRMSRQYFYGFRNACLSVKEILENVTFGSTDPVADFIDGNFGD